MTGNLYIKGTDPRFYQNSPKQLDTSWPPRFMKFILHLSPSASDTPSASTSKARFRPYARVGLPTRTNPTGKSFRDDFREVTRFQAAMNGRDTPLSVRGEEGFEVSLRREIII